MQGRLQAAAEGQDEVQHRPARDLEVRQRLVVAAAMPSALRKQIHSRRAIITHLWTTIQAEGIRLST